MNPLSEKIDSKEKLVTILRNRWRCSGNTGLEGVTTYVFRYTKAGYGKLTDDTFHLWRDALRKYTGYHEPLQISNFSAYVCSKPTHFLHLAKQPGLVAFAENEEKAKRDVFTCMKFSKYLTKFYPELGNEVVKTMTAKFNYLHGEPPEVLFSEKEEDFIRVINEGPSSCMAGMSYKGHIHPAAVYASGDIQIAWITDGQRITARTLCNKEKKTHVRTYGDESKLNKILSDLGYEQKREALVGCKIRRIENRNGEGYIMPYIDAGTGPGGGSLDYDELSDGDYFELVPDGSATSTYTGYEHGGVTERQEEDYYCYCEDCGDGIESGDAAYYIENHGSVCETCRDNNYTYAQTDTVWHCMAYVHSDDCTYVECLERHVHNDILCELDIIYDENRSKWFSLEDCEDCVVSQNTFFRDDMKECGEDKYGTTLWIHEDEIPDAKDEGNLLEDEDGNIFWHDSVEGQEITEKEKQLELDLDATHFEETNT